MRYIALLVLPLLVLCAENSITNLRNTTLSKNSSLLSVPDFTTKRLSSELVPYYFSNENSSLEPFPNYGFYRTMTWGQELKRNHCLFDTASGSLTEFAAACVLLNEHYSPRCSAAFVTKRWAVTAAHCMSMGIAFLLYNAQSTSSSEGDIVKVQHMYRHPQYEVEERDDGKGLGVDVLLHDVGLVYVAKAMKLKFNLQVDPLIAMKMFKAADLIEDELQVIGFGHTTTLSTREGLFSVKMRMVNCTSSHWFHCICGVPNKGNVSVCMADSGGPVLYRGVQVAITSMGPLSCVSSCAQPQAFATSVFTVLYPYATLINDTIHNSRHGIQMVKLTDGGGVSIRSQLTYIVLGLVISFCIYVE